MFPGIPQPVKLGLAGGPLVVSIISRFGPQYKLITYDDECQSDDTRNRYRLVPGLRGVGCRKGFIDTIIYEGGYVWIGYGAIITVVPLLVTGFMGRYFWKLNYYTLIGYCCPELTQSTCIGLFLGLDILRCPCGGIRHGLSAGYVPAGADGSVADTGVGVVSP